MDIDVYHLVLMKLRVYLTKLTTLCLFRWYAKPSNDTLI